MVEKKKSKGEKADLGRVLWFIPKTLTVAQAQGLSTNLGQRLNTLQDVLAEEPDGGNLLVRIW